jgi:hypothetical protein
VQHTYRPHIEVHKELVSLRLVSKVDEHHANDARARLAPQHAHGPDVRQVGPEKDTEVGHAHVTRDGKAAEGRTAAGLRVIHAASE